MLNWQRRSQCDRDEEGGRAGGAGDGKWRPFSPRKLRANDPNRTLMLFGARCDAGLNDPGMRYFTCLTLRPQRKRAKAALRLCSAVF